MLMFILAEEGPLHGARPEWPRLGSQRNKGDFREHKTRMLSTPHRALHRRCHRYEELEFPPQLCDLWFVLCQAATSWVCCSSPEINVTCTNFGGILSTSW